MYNDIIWGDGYIVKESDDVNFLNQGPPVGDFMRLLYILFRKLRFWYYWISTSFLNTPETAKFLVGFHQKLGDFLNKFPKEIKADVLEGHKTVFTEPFIMSIIDGMFAEQQKK